MIVNGMCVAVEIGDRSSGLTDENYASRHIPGEQACFPVAVKSARRNVAEIKRGRAEPPEAACQHKEIREMLDNVPRIRDKIVGKTRHDEAAHQVG